jgi:RNA polymerase sigma-70 factor (ECF subfamily)
VPLFLQRPELLAGFHRGDERALEEVYWAYFPRIEVVARHGSLLLRSGTRVRGAPDSAEVEDLVHETFARAFTDKARKSYDGKRPYGPYLAAIARNLLVDAARRRGRELPTAELPDDLPEEVTEVPEWAEPETVRAVEAYLSELPKELRDVHEQRYVKSCSQEAAATALGLSRQQIRTLEQRLRDGLREHLKKISSQTGARAVGTVGAVK